MRISLDVFRAVTVVGASGSAQFGMTMSLPSKRPVSHLWKRTGTPERRRTWKGRAVARLLIVGAAFPTLFAATRAECAPPAPVSCSADTSALGNLDSAELAFQRDRLPILFEASAFSRERRPSPATEDFRLSVSAEYSSSEYETSAGIRVIVSEDGAISFREPAALRPEYKAGRPNFLIVHFDLNDVMFRLIGMDPYAAEKARAAELSRDERLQVAKMAASSRRREALLDVKARAERIASDGSIPPSTRRSLLFDLWNDCAANDYGVEGVEEYRASVISVIRRHFPNSTRGGYSKSELEALAGRSTRGAFQPYGGN